MLSFFRGKRGHYVFPDEYPPMSRDVFTVAAFRLVVCAVLNSLTLATQHSCIRKKNVSDGRRTNLSPPTATKFWGMPSTLSTSGIRAGPTH